MRKIIATGKGGAGKTTIVATLSRLLAMQGFRVLVIDTDPSMNPVSYTHLDVYKRQDLPWSDYVP